MNRMLPLMLVLTALSACADPPTFQDISADRVIVMSNGSDASVVQAEAMRGCAIYNRNPVLMSKTCTDDFCMQRRYLFACRVT